MKYTLLAVSLMTLLGLSACTSAEQSAETTAQSIQQVEAKSTIDWSQAGPDAKANKISFADVQEAVQNGAKFYDVRTPEEFAAGNFGITENLPLAELKTGHHPDVAKDTPIYVHCEQGNWSAQATQLLRDAGFTNVYDLGGIKHVKAIGVEFK